MDKNKIENYFGHGILKNEYYEENQEGLKTKGIIN